MLSEAGTTHMAICRVRALLEEQRASRGSAGGAGRSRDGPTVGASRRRTLQTAVHDMRNRSQGGHVPLLPPADGNSADHTCWESCVS